MAQLILAVIITIAVVLFGMVNTHHVVLQPVVGEPVQIRMVFLLSIAFISGSVTTFFYQMISRIRRRAERKRRRLRASTRINQVVGAR